MKSITELNEESFESILLAAKSPVVVDFYAPWCGPCIMLAPVLEQLAEHYAGKIQFCKINIEDAPALAVRWQISGVPTLMLFREGEVRDTLVGFPSPQVLVRKLQDLAEASALEVRT